MGKERKENETEKDYVADEARVTGESVWEIPISEMFFRISTIWISNFEYPNIF